MLSIVTTKTDTQKPGQLLSTYSALQLPVEHMPEHTDRQKIQNAASHIVQIVFGDNSLFSIGLKQPECKAGQKFYLL
jgi:hypothetical protein